MAHARVRLCASEAHQALCCTHFLSGPGLHARAGTPCVFYDHLRTEGNGLRKAILELMEVRKAHGIHVRCVQQYRGACVHVCRRGGEPIDVGGCRSVKVLGLVSSTAHASGGRGRWRPLQFFQTGRVRAGRGAGSMG